MSEKKRQQKREKKNKLVDKPYHVDWLELFQLPAEVALKITNSLVLCSVLNIPKLVYTVVYNIGFVERVQKIEAFYVFVECSSCCSSK